MVKPSTSVPRTSPMVTVTGPDLAQSACEELQARLGGGDVIDGARRHQQHQSQQTQQYLAAQSHSFGVMFRCRRQPPEVDSGLATSTPSDTTGSR